MRRGTSKKGPSNTPPNQIFTLEDPEFYDLWISNVEHRERFVWMARMGVQNTKFALEEVVVIGIHGNVLALFTLLGWKHVMYAN